MAQPITFDTHAYVKKLTATGVPEEQAEVHAGTLADLIDGRLSTKHDLKILETELKRDTKQMETELKRDMKEMELRLRHDLTVRLGGMMALSITVVAALVKVL